MDLFLLGEILSQADHPDKRYVEDLAQGFNVTSNIDAGDLGELLDGGQRVNRQPGLGGPENIEDLRKQCYTINCATIDRARAKAPNTPESQFLAEQAWSKFMKDVGKGYANVPVDIEEVNLHDVLLVDSFPVMEQHAGSEPKVSVINNYRQNIK